MPPMPSTPRSKSRKRSSALQRRTTSANAGLLTNQPATPNRANGRLNKVPRINPTVRLSVRNEAIMPMAIIAIPMNQYPINVLTKSPPSGSPRPHLKTKNMEKAENIRETEKMATPAMYLPSTTSKSLAGDVSNNSSVPCLRSSAQMLMVIAGMNTSMIKGSQRLSWSRLARLLEKNSGGQNVANALSTTNTQIKT